MERIKSTILDRADRSDPLNLTTVIVAKITLADGSTWGFKVQVERMDQEGFWIDDDARVRGLAVSALIKHLLLYPAPDNVIEALRSSETETKSGGLRWADISLGVAEEVAL